MENLKTERINIQVTPDQKQMIKDAAKAVGLTVSGYTLFCLFEKMGERLGDVIVSALEKDGAKNE